MSISSDCGTGKMEEFLKVIYEKTKNIDAVRRLLGHSSVTATSSYIGVTDNYTLDLERSANLFVPD